MSEEDSQMTLSGPVWDNNGDWSKREIKCFKSPDFTEPLCLVWQEGENCPPCWSSVLASSLSSWSQVTSVRLTSHLPCRPAGTAGQSPGEGSVCTVGLLSAEFPFLIKSIMCYKIDRELVDHIPELKNRLSRFHTL